MKKFSLVAMVAFIGIIVFATGASAEVVREGKWSMTIVTTVAGMPGAADAMKEMENMSPEDKAMMQQMMGGMGVSANGSGITTTITKCLTNENPVPEREEGCQTTHSLQGNAVNFESVCPTSRSNGQIMYDNAFMHGTIQSHSNDGDATIEITGQYLGPCQD